MYAIVQTGGKQYKVAEGETLLVEKLVGDVGANVDLSQVLMIGGSGAPKIGTPTLNGANVSAEIVKQGRGAKIVVFKKKRRKGYKKKQGHRQSYTTLKVMKING